ncbi:EAL domain-containing protein [Enterobacter cloacae]|uniref:EAL domain-containing protein n=1 Tax=Enterobacter cloacae TaxID=550 RepID=UPI002005EA37|nr:EAL domain-containing protein [Enterobacter cloacae]MCK7268873.1 EAL domain-containing protein [Enterobacter cloacae]
MNQVRKEIRRMWSCIEGIRLQPFIHLETGEQTGQEALSVLSAGIEPEHFFPTFAPDVCLLQFFDQMDIVRQMKLTTPCFLNLPVRVLAEPECVRRLTQVRVCYRRNIVIEVQDPAEIVIAEGCMADAVMSGVSTLRGYGWQVWLDDLTYSVCRVLSRAGMQFDGVKIDRKELAYPQSLETLVKQARQLVISRESNVLIEGIETEDDLARARNSGARWGQGFLWPEKRITFR